MYDIKIEEVFNGFIVTIGCRRVVIEGRGSMASARVELMGKLTAYLADREGTEKSWRKQFGRPAPTMEPSILGPYRDVPAVNAEG